MGADSITASPTHHSQPHAAGKQHAPAARRPRILVAGLGNDLLMDDGVGVHVARRLRDQLPMGVRVAQVGTAVLDAIHLFERADFIVAVDAMQADGTPGTVYRFRLSDVEARDQTTSLHEFSFAETLRFMKTPPVDVVIVGVEPQIIDYGLEMTAVVDAAVDCVIAEIKEVIAEWLNRADGGQRASSR
jgi:hydrogenase maturation protease